MENLKLIGLLLIGAALLASVGIMLVRRDGMLRFLFGTVAWLGFPWGLVILAVSQL